MFGQKGQYKVVRQGSDIELLPKDKHTHTLIFMHGLGDSADGYLDFFMDSTTPTPPTMKIVLLTAPVRAVTVNMGMKMNSWFDFKDFNLTDQNFAQVIGIKEADESAEIIGKAINKEIGILGGDSKKIFVGGFSQGAIMTLRTGLTFNKTLGGLIVLSGFMFPTIKEDVSNVNTPILISHGADDPLLPCAMCVKTYDRLDKNAHQCKIEVIRQLAHSFNLESVKLFKAFLTKYAI